MEPSKFPTKEFYIYSRNIHKVSDTDIMSVRDAMAKVSEEHHIPIDALEYAFIKEAPKVNLPDFDFAEMNCPDCIAIAVVGDVEKFSKWIREDTPKGRPTPLIVDTTTSMVTEFPFKLIAFSASGDPIIRDKAREWSGIRSQTVFNDVFGKATAKGGFFVFAAATKKIWRYERNPDIVIKINNTRSNETVLLNATDIYHQLHMGSMTTFGDALSLHLNASWSYSDPAIFLKGGNYTCQNIRDALVKMMNN